MVLEYKINQFDGGEIDPLNLPVDEAVFSSQLKNTLSEFKSRNLKVAWLSLPMNRASLVAAAVDCGFIYHHADKDGVLLTFKLDNDAFVPGYATHYIGAGGVVIDDKNRLLVIQEKYHTTKHYKLPGGTLDPGEHISQAVVREVFEETGIKTEFVSLNCFRHFHGYRYGKSDFYFVCRLKPLTTDISIDEEEISKSIWMPVDDFLNDPETRPFNRKVVAETIKGGGLSIDTIPGYGIPEIHEMMFVSEPESSKKTLEFSLGELLIKNNQTISCAESCTGGNIAHRITEVSGSSAYFLGGVVSYHNSVKQGVLGVKSESLEQYGAVSRSVVEEMAVGVRSLMKTDWAVATSGIAGPSGGSAEKPVGTVWIAWAGPDGVESCKFQFGNSRIENINLATESAISGLINRIRG